MAGNGRLTEKVRQAASECERVQFLGYIPQDQVLEEVSRCDAVVCMMDPSNGNNAIGTPNKLFEAMAYGVPAIVTIGTHSGDMVRRLDCGVAIEYDARGMSSAIASLRDPQTRTRKGRNGRAAAEKDYNWKAMKDLLCAVYDRLPIVQ
jgi:glycosyltransferase involved in cell wall biosynthesis